MIKASDKITIQSMTTTKTADIAATVKQIIRLEAFGCDIVRVAVPDMESADAVAEIKEKISIPLVADIHFNYKLALRAIERGADKIRINPGNIGTREDVRTIARACKEKNIPIRVGVNSGSLERDLLSKYGGVTPEAMAESAMGQIRLLEQCGFHDIWVSAKCPDVPLTVRTYRLLSERTVYPLHIGVTEAGTEYSGIIKNAIGIGSLLLDGIGSTIRVSLTAEPEREVLAAKAILKALGLRGGIDVFSCPTCGRCNIGVKALADEVQTRLASSLDRGHGAPLLKVAVMGCAVNGPGEASQADYGIAGGKGEGIIFAKGRLIKKAPMDKLVDELLALIDS